MPSLKDIRNRIEATKNTQQITKAMKLVAAAKLRKAQHQIVNMRPYAYSLIKVIEALASDPSLNHPFLNPPAREGKKNLLLVVITSDRGLCGSFNSQIIRYTDSFLREKHQNYQTIDIVFIGRKGAEYFAKKQVRTVEVIQRLDRDISYNMAKVFALKIMDYYLKGTYQEVKFIYNEFKSAISQKVICEHIIPVLPNNVESMSGVEYKFEPSKEHILNELLEKHFILQTYRCLCESVAAEHGARMTAMENATNNSKELIYKLTLTYNKLRQEKITTELIEIVSGAEAL
ncbi:MAG: ATP synthase F1 subunit gamma [Bdellovibrionaceae bacterium]|nr:ATP synthase F1 subunit gamma [Pseudobdellovibrionaceae bacterium]MDW8189362.1 ATP synthase F1 subunit gamma [Pseudobdellovibrionaceae bacterium]